MATNKVLNVKYGKKENLPSSKQDGALYVATKENNKAELYVDLDSTRYLISESATVDPELSSTSENALQNKVIYSELTDLQTQIDGRATSAYATCPTAAATAEKVITTQGGTDWVLKAGSIITVLFTYTNEASNPTFNVNGTGAKNVYYGASRITTSSLSYAGYKNRPMNFMYDGTQYRFIGWGVDSNSDTKVKQLSAITTAGEYPVILGYNTATSEVTNSVNKTSTLKYNPSTQILTAPTFKGNLDGNAATADSALEATVADSLSSGAVGNSTTPVYFNSNGVPAAADAYSTILTDATSTADKNLSITAGGTKKEIEDLYATYIATTNKNTTKAYVMGSTGTDTTPIYDTGVYLDTTSGQLTATKFSGALDGTASLAQNLNGLSASVTELNTLDGIDTAQTVQEQLDLKATKATATLTEAGLMSASDKAKLDSIASGANKTVVDSALSSSSTNPVQNKVINAALTNVTTNAQSYADEILVDAKEYSDANLTTAKSYSDTNLATAKSYADTKKTEAINSAKTYTDTQDGVTLASAKEYAESQDALTLDAAKTDATNKANSALASAKSDATTKANNALSSAKDYTDDEIAALIGDASNQTLEALEDYIDSQVSSTGTNFDTKLRNYLPLAGGTLTGNLTGTNVSMSGTVSATGGFTGDLDGNAETASALKVSAAVGSATQPIYIDSTGKPKVANAYSTIVSDLNSRMSAAETNISNNTAAIATKATKDVATTSANGLMSSTDKKKVDSISGYYGTCSTAATTAAKVVTCSNFVLATGATIFVKFTNAQTYNGTATLNVNGTGAKSIMRAGTTAAPRYCWQAGETVGFTYDGTNYVMHDGGLATTTYYGVTKLSSSTSSDSESVAATPKAVKTVADNLTNLSTNLSNNYYTKTEADAAFDAKGSASSAQTAATNAAKTYTDNQISALIGKASAGYQTLEEIEEKITSNDGDIADLSANFSNYYTKTAANAAFDAKGSASNAQTAATNAAKSYTDTAIANLINGAPEDLNTLKELADALAGDDSAIADINAALSTKANAEDLTKHINETDGKGKLHITSAERTKWDGYDSGKAPTSHKSTATTYGVGDNDEYGHLKLSDSTSSDSSTSGGIAATPKAVKAAYNLASDANAALSTKADASALTSHTTNTTVHITAAERTAWNGKAPTSHKSTATTYGVGDNDEYGHLKLSDSTNSDSSTSGGIAATPKAVKAAYDLAANTSADLGTKAPKEAGVYYIIGEGTTAGTWLGSDTRITNLYDGLTIAYKIPIAGASTTTLNINSLGAKTVKLNASTALTTHYPVGAIVLLVYDASTETWKISNYDANTRNTVGDYVKNGTKLYFVGTQSADTATTSSYATSYVNNNIYVTTGNVLHSTSGFEGNLTGTATMANTATTAEKLASGSVGSSTNPVYFNGGVPVQCGNTLNVDISGAAFTLSQTLPIEKGGTDAVTLEGAQENLGITALNNEVSDLEANVNSLEAELATNVSTLQSAIETGDSETLASAASDASTKANEAETNAKAYTDSELNAFITGSFNNLQNQVNNNTNTISTHENSIANNTSSISTNTQNININKIDIETNTSNIAANTTAINTTNSALTTHKNTKATGSVLGHVTLSDTASNTNDATKGIAATPKAVYAVANDLTTHIAAAEELYIYVGDEELGTTPTKDADTLNGKTAAQIIAEASGQTAEAGTVGFSTSTITSGTAVTLTNVSTGDALLPRTSIANVTGLQAKLDTIPAQPMVYVTGTTAPTGAIGTIWFEGPVSGKYTIRIWNGSAWEVMNSWQ